MQGGNEVVFLESEIESVVETGRNILGQRVDPLRAIEQRRLLAVVPELELGPFVHRPGCVPARRSRDRDAGVSLVLQHGTEGANVVYRPLERHLESLEPADEVAHRAKAPTGLRFDTRRASPTDSEREERGGRQCKKPLG